jgi:hypothetical protein
MKKRIYEKITKLALKNLMISEGGAVGHLSHLTDNRELTFAEIKEVIISATEGKLEKVSEKLDGMNLVFTFDLSVDSLKVARSGGDIKRGGMNASDLAKKFFGRGNVEKAFNEAFKVLNGALSSLSEKSKILIFGENGNKWYSLEIIYAEDPNTISYDSNSLVFHGWPVFEIQDNGQIVQGDDSGISELTSKIDQMQKAVKLKDWKLNGPSLVTMNNLSSGKIANELLAQVDSIKNSVGLSDSDTLYDYLIASLENEIPADFDSKIKEMLLNRSAQVPGAPSVNDIKAVANKSDHATISEFVKSSEEKVKQIIKPLDAVIQKLAVEVLRGVKSTLISDSNKEVERLKSQVEKAISVINSSGHEQAIEILNKELSRLGSVDNITAAMEGVVFFYKGHAYKFTGAFAPVHQILALFKYGRKGIPKFDLKESKKYLLEGGNAFDDVSQISLADFNKVWPKIERDILELGCTNISFIGTTGKKHIMGDIDLAAEFDAPFEDLLHSAQSYFGDVNVKKVGSNIVTIRYPYKSENKEKFVQVDLMIGDSKYLKWARFGTSNIEGHKDYSPLKGVARNILLNTINNELSDKLIGKNSSETERVKFAIDFDRGLFKVTQTKISAKGNKLKDWQTINREFMSKDPNIIAQVMFGKDISADDIRKFEDLVDVTKKSIHTSKLAKSIFDKFLIGLENAISKKSDLLGHDTESAVKYIKTIL